MADSDPGSKNVLGSASMGAPCRVRLRMFFDFAVLDSQPFLRELEQFLLMDVETLILDVVRLLFGEPVSIRCSTQRVQRDIRGEDTATTMLRFASGETVRRSSRSFSGDHGRGQSAYTTPRP
jgi:D-apiose dehydrogenase